MSNKTYKVILELNDIKKILSLTSKGLGHIGGINSQILALYKAMIKNE